MARHLSEQSIRVLSITMAVVFCVADWVLPEAVTPDILLCAVVLVASGSARPSFAWLMAWVCTVLIWVGLLPDLIGHFSLATVFDHFLVTIVVWLIATIGIQRRAARAEQERLAAELVRSN